MLPYVRERLSPKTLTEHEHDSIIGSMFLEIRRCKLITELIDYRDLSVETSNILMEQFWSTYKLKNEIKKPTPFKSIDSPFCLDLILTIHYKCFLKSQRIFKLDCLISFWSTYFLKQRTGISKYRDWKNHLKYCWYGLEKTLQKQI